MAPTASTAQRAQIEWRLNLHVQGYFAHKNPPPPRPLPTLGLCLGPCDGPWGRRAFFYERGTPVPEQSEKCEELYQEPENNQTIFFNPRRMELSHIPAHNNSVEIEQCILEHRQFIEAYRGTSLIRNRHPVGPYRRTIPRLLWRSWGGGRSLMSEVHVPLYSRTLW